MPFVVGAVAVAFTASVLVVYSTPPADNYSRGASLGYMTFVFLLPALALAAAAWLTVERVLRKKQRTATMEASPAAHGAENPGGASDSDDSERN